MSFHSTRSLALAGCFLFGLASATSHHLPRQEAAAPPDCSLPETNGTTYTLEGSSFEILCGYDFFGFDYAFVAAPTFSDCINACDADEPCIVVAYNYAAQSCYLKEAAGPTSPAGWVYAARKLPDPNAPLNCIDSGKNDTLYTIGLESEFHILCGIDFAGGDLGAPLLVDNFEVCITACDSNEECVDVSYDSRIKTCYMKDRIGAANQAAWVWTARKNAEPRPVVSCDADAGDNTLYVSGEITFLIMCGVDYAGGDMGAAPQPSFARCMDMCAETTGCIDVSYSGMQCYMKGILGELVTAGWVWTGKVVPNDYDPTSPPEEPGPVDPEEPPTGEPQLSCAAGASDGSIYVAASGNQYTVICGSEYPGGDPQGVEVASFEACIEACDTTPRCIDVSYVGPQCYMKSSISTLQAAGWVSTALRVDRPEPVPSVSCVDGGSNGTIHITAARNQYEILCGVDYGAGDMGMVFADSFVECMDMCDASEGCVDVSYSGTACYMKSSVGERLTADWVWNARFIGRVPVSTSSASSSSSSTATTDTTMTSSGGSVAASTSDTATSTSTATESTWTPGPSETACASSEGRFIPSQDADIDRLSLERFVPSREAVLNYAEEPGNRVLQLELELTELATMLENSARITSVGCLDSQLAIGFSTTQDRESAIEAWTVGQILMITYSPSCNLEAARGFYFLTLVEDSYTFPDETTVVFSGVESRNMTQIASQMTIRYGTIDSGEEIFTSSATAAPSEPSPPPASTCSLPTGSSTASTTSTPSATTEPSARPLPQTLEDLTPAARELYDYLMENMPLDENGNLDYFFPPNSTIIEMATPEYNPDDLSDQAALEDELAELGLSRRGDLISTATNGLESAEQGMCESPSAVAKRQLATSPRRMRRHTRRASDRMGLARKAILRALKARGDDDFSLWDVGCNDFTTGLIGKLWGEGYETGAEAVCAGKDAYDNRDSWKCILGGCQTRVSTVKTITYTFESRWGINFPTISQWLKRIGDMKVMSCVNCGFSMPTVSFMGTIVVVNTDGELSIKSAEVTPGVTASATMLVHLQTDGAWTSNWSHAFQATDLGTITLDSAFSIKPKVLFSLGIQWDASSAVDVTAGATFSWNDAAAPIDIVARSKNNARNWRPSVSLTIPTFKTGATVSIIPWTQWAVKLDVNIQDMLTLSPAITSQTVIGLESKFILTAGTCAANQLQVNTYLFTESGIGFGEGSGAILYSDTAASANGCLEVPGIVPTPEEVQSLAAVAGPYCASLVRYTTPTRIVTATSTSTTKSVITETIEHVITSTTRVTEWSTTSYETWSTTSVPATTVTVTATNAASTNAFQTWKRGLDLIPEPTAAAHAVARRQLSPPWMVNGWDPAKVTYACKLVATGTKTSTYTTSTTVTSGAVTRTVTVTRNQNGPVTTQTISLTSTKFLGLKTVTTPGTATFTAAALPSTSCFRIVAHGVPWLEDKYLRYNENGSPLIFERMGMPNTAFYLTDKGKLMAHASGRAYVVGTRAGMGGQIGNNNPVASTLASFTLQGWSFAKCAKDRTDPCSKRLLCSIVNPFGVEVYGMSVADLEWDEHYLGANSYNTAYLPYWGTSVVDGKQYLPITLTYEDTPCPLMFTA